MEAGEEVELDVEMAMPSMIPNKVNMYGVSSLSTREITEFIDSVFAPMRMQPEVKIEWIDDESCNAVFLSDSIANQLLSLGTPVEGSVDGSVSMLVPPTIEGGEAQPLTLRRATEADTKSPARSWRDSKYYKKRLEQKGINPETLAPISKVILKPREGAKVSPAGSKVSLISRKQVQQARSAMYGEEAFSKKRERMEKRKETEMVVDEEELKRRQERAQRFANHL